MKSETSTGIIKVAMADDHSMLRNALANLIEGFGEYSVVLQASNGKELMQKLATVEAPDILLLDINMPVMNGMETARLVTTLFPDVKILALSMLDDEQSLIGMIKSGARGYVLKDADPAILQQALQNVIRYGYHYSEKLTGRLIHSIQQEKGNHQTGITENGIRISEREREFLAYACTEMTYKEIAEAMFVSPRTVDGYRDGLFEKLQVKSRVGLAMFAVKTGIFKL